MRLFDMLKGGPGSGPHPGEGHKGSDTKAAVEEAVDKLKAHPMGRHASTDKDYGNDKSSETNSGHMAGIRDFGDWENERDDDSEDSDHQVPTAKTVAAAKEVIAGVQERHPGVKLSLRGGEKNWTYVHADRKGKADMGLNLQKLAQPLFGDAGVYGELSKEDPNHGKGGLFAPKGKGGKSPKSAKEKKPLKEKKPKTGKTSRYANTR